MALGRLGEVTEFMMNENFTLQVGTNYYLAVENLVIQVSRPEERRGTLDSGAKYAFGQGDNFFSCTLIATKPEVGVGATSFNELSKLDSNGELTSTLWKIIGESVGGGGTLTIFAATGVIKQYAVRKGTQGKVVIDILVRILGDTVTIT